MSKDILPPHYASSYRAGDFIFISGQLPLISRDPVKKPNDLFEQTLLVLENTEILLANYGIDRKAIVKTTAFITDIEKWPIVNKGYASFFGDHKPARSVVPVAELHFGCDIEIESIAYIGEYREVE